MGFDDTWIFRDCPWCGLRHGQFIAQAHVEAARRGKTPRHWTMMTCPRCGAPVTLEITPPNAIPRIMKTILDTAAAIDVARLPADVERYYHGSRTDEATAADVIR